jgi:urease accessory protein UreF
VIEALIPGARAQRTALADLGVTEDSISVAYRRRRPLEGSQIAWLDRLSGRERERLRTRGRELVAMLLSYLDAEPAESDRLLESASAKAAAYGRVAAKVQASLSDTVQGFLRFRTPFLGELAREASRRRLATQEATALLIKAEEAMDRLLVAVMQAHGRHR